MFIGKCRKCLTDVFRFQPDETKANDKEDKKPEAGSKDDKKENSGSTEGGDKQVQNGNTY